jgi:hypothetical protein
MGDAPDFDVQQAHEHFAKSCFNRVWDLLDRARRTSAEDDEMVSASHASLWHWTQVAGHTPTNLSIARWQLSRVYATVGQAANAEHYGRLCVDVSAGLDPFYAAYAWEAYARAAALAGDASAMEERLAAARRLSELIDDPGHRGQLEIDLDEIGIDE